MRITFHCVTRHETSNIVYKNYEKDDVYTPNKPIDNKWVTERRKNKPRRNKINSYPTIIESINKYNLLHEEDENCDSLDVNGNEPIITKHQIWQNSCHGRF